MDMVLILVHIYFILVGSVNFLHKNEWTKDLATGNLFSHLHHMKMP